jgi:PAS domain S-box-containing protein
VESARDRAEAALRRDAGLEAVAFAAQRFLETPEWEPAVPRVLRRIGEAVSASRVLLYENGERAGVIDGSLAFEWCASGVPTKTGTECAGSTGYEGFERWVTVLARGDLVLGPVDGFPASERACLGLHGVRSTLVAPIFVGREWWGYVAFEDCVDARRWTQIEIDALRALAGTIASAIQRKRSEQQLLEAERSFRALVENIPAVVYREDFEADPHLFYISPQVTQMFGYSPEEWTWTPGFWVDHIHPEDRERVLTEDESTNAMERRYAIEYRFRVADGSYVWVHDEATPVVHEGERPFWQGFMLDVTERKRAEERVTRALEVEREATARLRTLDEMKNTFLQAVSHDLRTPLAAILGLAVTLERSDIQLPPEETRDLAKRIAINSRKLDKMVTDLLDLDRLGRGIVEPNLRPTDVGALVRRVVSEADLMSQGRVQVEAAPVLVHVDPAKVERIVENLLANTARHTPSGSPVLVRVESLDGGVLVAVDDRGPGVPDEHKEAVFEPFRQGPQPSAHSPGVGVGLALVARFAELLGGRAWVEDREGGGASFRVWLADGEPGEASTV